MRILWLSNAEWCPSGYGEQTAMFVRRFQALGHDVAIAANHGLQEATMDWNGVTTYPASGNWGNQHLSTFAHHHKAELIISLCDSWVLKPDQWDDDIRVAAWTPLDHYPIPPPVLTALNHEKITPIAMSQFGFKWMQDFKLDPLYVPHGVDTNLFKPRPEIRDKVRDELGIPRDAFLVGMVAANRASPILPRKGFSQAFDAFAQFASKHKDAWLYVHADATEGQKGIDLDVLAKALKTMIDFPLEHIRFPPLDTWKLGFPKAGMANLYQAFDVLLNPSLGEGFGIPIIEAQASGVPVITSDHSSMTELTQAGWLVTGDRLWDPAQQSWLILPTIASIGNALEAAYEKRGNKELREGAREFAMMYDADRVTLDYWMPALERLGKPREIQPLKLNRAQRRKLAKA
jgi:glycosyltransferase involved in cell wall biosynthesis